MRKMLFWTLSVVVVMMAGCAKLEEGNQRQNPVAMTTQVHAQGWMDYYSSEFHGYAIQSLNYNMKPCQQCHGTDYRGGTTRTSCFTCHTSGPEACNVCHGSSPDNIAPPADLHGNTDEASLGVGAHQTHLRTTDISSPFPCITCHLVPASNNDPVHIDTIPGTRVVFNTPLASTATTGITPVPVYDHGTGTCANVYCHGDFKNGNTANTVVWNGVDQAECGSCHGNRATGNPLPGGTHPQGTQILDCQNCHFYFDTANNQVPVARHLPDGSWVIVTPAKHVNGTVTFNTGDIPINFVRR